MLYLIARVMQLSMMVLAATLLGIMLVMIGVVIFVINALWYGIVFSNSETTYLLLNHHPKYYDVITMTGMCVEDIPQLCIQITYSIHMKYKFGYSLTGIQIASFTFTGWRLMFTIAHKYMMRHRRPSPVTDTPGVMVELAESAISLSQV